MKKAVSIILAAILLLMTAIPMVSADEIKEVPIITIPGTSNADIFTADGERIIPDNVEIGDIIGNTELMKALLTEFGKATVTGKWDKYCDMLYDALAPIWEKQVFDNNGDAKWGDTTRTNYNFAPARTSGFIEGQYYMQYDWRVDPEKAADNVETYVNAVRRATGADKVGIVARCYGGCVLSAYINKYGTDKIDTAIYNCTMSNGNENVGAVFSGKFFFDPDCLDLYANYYLSNNDLTGDENLNTLLGALVTLLNYTGALDLTAKGVSKLLDQFIPRVFPRLLRASYASWPGYWAMVGDEYFDDAIKYVFGGVEEEYAGLIEKITTYHNEVLLRQEELIDSGIENGMNICFISKYGTPTYPIFKGADMQTDGSCSIPNMTFGCSAAKINKTYSDLYVLAAKAKGEDKYISADRKIDASTGKYRDMTWFAKDAGHTEHPAYLRDLMTAVCARVDQMTVWDDPAYPQFAHKVGNQYLPLTEADPEDAKWNRDSFFKTLAKFMRSFNAWLKAFIHSRLFSK